MNEADKTVHTIPDSPEQTADMAPAPARQAPITPESFDVTAKKDKDGNPIRDFVSAGEKVHNELTYRGVDWLMNSAFGVAFAVFTARTEAGRKFFSQPVEKFFTKALSPVLKKEETLKSGATWGSRFVSIMFGGTVTIPPLMLLENHKVKRGIVKSLDVTIYGKEQVENDPKFKQAYQEIDQQPKKDFSTGMYARFLALAPLLAFTVYKPTNEFVKKHFYDHIAKGSKYVGEKMGLGKSAFWKKTSSAGNEGVAISNWQYMHDTIGFDFGVTILYSFIHEATYKLFAKKKDDKRHFREDVKEVAKEMRAEGKLPTRDEQAETAIAASGPTGPTPEPKPTEKPLPQISDMQHISALAAPQASQTVGA